MPVRANQQEPVIEPGRALNGVIFAIIVGLVSLWLARQTGWEAAWAGVVFAAVAALGGVRRLVRAHQAWRKKRDLEAAAHGPGVHRPTRKGRLPEQPDSW